MMTERVVPTISLPPTPDVPTTPNGSSSAGGSKSSEKGTESKTPSRRPKTARSRGLKTRRKMSNPVGTAAALLSPKGIQHKPKEVVSDSGVNYEEYEKQFSSDQFSPSNVVAGTAHLVQFPKDDISIVTFPQVKRTPRTEEMLSSDDKELDRQVQDSLELFTSDFVTVEPKYNTFTRTNSDECVFEKPKLFYQCESTKSCKSIFLHYVCMYV